MTNAQISFFNPGSLQDSLVLSKYIVPMSCTNCQIHKQSTSNSGDRHIPEAVLSSCNKLDVFDWLKNIPDEVRSDLTEVKFKNTRKEFYANTNHITIKRGDIIVLEADKGFDVGVVSLTGRLAEKQFELKIKNRANYEPKKIYRKATGTDLQKWYSAKELENPVLIRAKKIIRELHLNMKLSDVEYRGDKEKATFYYIADERVDFRELIKVFAEEFKVRIEMKQIGARQEAARIGGIGSCGRELCCSTWRTDLATVTLQAIKYQDLPLNAQRFAGQCGKLKCCLMYELDTYIENRKEFPKELLELETAGGILYRHKIDALNKIVWYSSQPDSPVNIIPLSLDKVKEIIMSNKKGIRPGIDVQKSGINPAMELEAHEDE